MTIKNNPKVNTVNGMVNRTNRGLMKLFSKPSTTATKNAVIELSTVTPFNRYATINTAKAVAIVFVKNLPIK
jgi:hypothetical protein